MSKVKVLVIRAPGTNRDGEAVFAFEKAGAEVTLAHVNQLIRGECNLFDYQIFVFPGGFSYGDDIASGRVLANELKLKFGQDMPKFIDDGRLVLGICNGFQVLVKSGFLPRVKQGETPRVTLTNNDSGKFECRWVYLGVNKKSPCVFTKGMESMYVPVHMGKVNSRAICKLSVRRILPSITRMSGVIERLHIRLILMVRCKILRVSAMIPAGFLV